VSAEEADAYFASRPRGSRIGAWASRQSRELDSRQALLDRVRDLEAEYEGREIPRPPHWSGYRVEPYRVEFWYGREFRLHERIEFTAGDEGWERRLLHP
jgi:pyridoxamine 5'-phosphate oxidase